MMRSTYDTVKKFLPNWDGDDQAALIEFLERAQQGQAHWNAAHRYKGMLVELAAGVAKFTSDINESL